MSAEPPALTPLRFVVPMPENVTNSGRGRSRHWRFAYREKTQYWDLLDLLSIGHRVATSRAFDATMRGFSVPATPTTPLTRVSIRSTMYLGGAMDDDNALARHKPLLDWLKTRGYLADDRKKNIVWESFPEQVVKRDGQYRIELTVSPLA